MQENNENKDMEELTKQENNSTEELTEPENTPEEAENKDADKEPEETAEADDSEEDDFSPEKNDEAEDEPEETENADENENIEENTENAAETEPDSKRALKERFKGLIKNKKLWITVGAAAGALACVYFGAAAYYSAHFFSRTPIQGYDCSNMTVAEAEKTITDSIDSYAFRLKERNGETEEIRGEDIDLVISSIGSVRELKDKQNPLKWLTDKENRNLRLDISLSMNEEKLAWMVDHLVCVALSRQNMEGAGALAIYQSDNTFSIPDDGQAVVSESRLFDKVRLGIYGLYGDMDLDVEGCYVKKADEDRMRESLALMNQCVGTRVTYLKGDERIILDGTTINEWLSIGEDYSVIINDEKVREYVSYLSSAYNTMGKTRSFVTSAGTPITVSGGNYGWWVNAGAEADALKEIIKGGQQTEREPIYRQTAASHGNVDIGNTYVEVNLAAQHLWYYHNGAVAVSTDFVSGDPTKGRATPTGVYSITYKERNATLKGEDYSSPVSFWMPFNGGIGLHDASWRGSFGGGIYKGNGSHGCVNLPYNAASTIFASISKGDPVIVY